MKQSVEEDKSEKQLIHVHEPWSVNYWCEELSLRADELKEIVKKVGPKAQYVREYLARKRLADWPVYY